MNWSGVLVGVACMLPMMQLAAAPPFEIGGLHVHLGFEEAVSRAEGLGGTCQLGTLRRGEVVTALCEYAACGGEDSNRPCAEQAQGSLHLEVLAQPVSRIGLEATAGADGLTRVSFIFEGDSRIVKESLVKRFGAPVSDNSDFSEKTWSHARRMQWRSGDDAMGLLLRDKAITLTTTAPRGESDSPARD
jgi:hypothetical protein